ncbi:MAG: D-alanine--D-alanine ligase [Alphaproteobacteria bacterium]|nr:D-alanine--D-alanine ligase [Alphaproteobacteria bacterium]
MTKVSPLPRLFQKHKPYARHIGVIFGDPSLPDHVKPEGRFTQRDHDEREDFLATLRSLPGYEITVFLNHANLVEELRFRCPDMVLNLCDNGYLNDPRKEMHITAMLEMLDIPYTGSGPFALSAAYDKSLVAATCKAVGVAVPEEYLLRRGEAFDDSRWDAFPAFVKPNAADNSFGITRDSLCHNRAQLRTVIAKFKTDIPGHDLLIQEFLPGTEYRVLTLGNRVSGYHCMPVMERNFASAGEGVPKFVTREYKYDLAGEEETSALRSKLSTLSLDKRDWLERQCVAIIERFQCFDYTICDFRADANGNIKLIDLNPNPSWDRGSLVGSYDIKLGYRYEDIVRFIVESAQMRHWKRFEAKGREAATA